MGRKRKDEEVSEEVLASAWTEWIDRIPEEDRASVAAVIRSCDVSSKAGLNNFLIQLLAETLAGHIHPVTLAAAKPFVEMLMANTYMMAVANGTPELAGPQAAEALLEMRGLVRERARPVRPVYTFDDQSEADVIDAAG